MTTTELQCRLLSRVIETMRLHGGPMRLLTIVEEVQRGWDGKASRDQVRLVLQVLRDVGEAVHGTDGWSLCAVEESMFTPGTPMNVLLHRKRGGGR
jgi:hypothetical protein